MGLCFLFVCFLLSDDVNNYLSDCSIAINFLI